MYIASKVILKYAVSGVQYALAEFEVDTASNLPQSTGTTKISIGSKANVVDTGAVYKMGANDTWILQEAGTASYTKAEVDALIQDAEDYADSEILGAINDLDVPAVGGSTKYVYQISQADGLIYADAYTSDSSPTTGSTKLVQSGGVNTYVDNGLANKITISDVFGLGTSIPTNSDLDSYTTTGTYYCQLSATASTLDNVPFDGSTFPYTAFRLIVEYINSANNVCQTLIPLNDNCTYFKRIKMTGATGTWRTWRYFDGTPVSTLNNLQSLGGDMRSSMNEEQEEEIIDDER